MGQDRVTFPPAIKLVTLVLGIYGSDFWTLAKADPMYMITPIIKEGKNVAARTEQELVVRPMYLAAVVKSLISRVDVNKQVLRKCIEDSASFLLMSRDKFSHDCAYEFIGEYLLNCEERDPLAKDLLYRFSHIISNDAKLIEKKESLYTTFMYGTMWSVNVVKEAYRTGASAK